MFTLEELGNKICIIGCSSCGKSTLADLLSKKLNIPVTHLDFLAHYPNTNWTRRPESELIAKHNEVLTDEKWIIEGNYSVCMKDRFAIATSVIWIDHNVLHSAFRYIKRCLNSNPDRIGRLPGSTTEFSFQLLKHILYTYPKNRHKYKTLIEKAKIPLITIHSMRELKQFSKKIGLAKGCDG